MHGALDDRNTQWIPSLYSAYTSARRRRLLIDTLSSRNPVYYLSVREGDRDVPALTVGSFHIDRLREIPMLKATFQPEQLSRIP